MTALNRQYYGVDTIAQLIRKYHPGGTPGTRTCRC
jgi:hypothetical protein